MSDGQGSFYDDELYDLERSRHRRDEGMTQAATAQRAVPWSIAADAWLAWQPAGTEFSANDITRVIGLPSHGPNMNNSIGAWFSAKARAKVIVFTGRFVKSDRVSRHINQNRVWRKR